ncbi:C45 family peptidase [Crossiella cryophila]|uniref:Putative choloylglycine hydrolase n=1 Tax=Crossiella cryophila TaxID=43355 RepID=A0A7W7CJ81_9PSEU|nr:C45 family peptidase [Crossiella cryophila]MBB4680763.1 putative choloylglycine hydrolase [Crossiella cryophila]
MGQQIVAGGGAADFATVRLLSAEGDQHAIGRTLAEAARQTYGWRPIPADRRKARARRRWFERNWPQHHERMRGAASLLGLDFTADEYYVDCLYPLPAGSACSASTVPPGLTEEGRGLLGRNYDFFTTTRNELFAMMTGAPPPAERGEPWAGRPTIVHSRPTDGPATLVLTMDTLDGCMDGINEHGLAVVLLIADAENTNPPTDETPQVGLASVQLPRFLLDTCASAEQARAALLDVKQYDQGSPLHYLIADASGDSFVWERGPGGDEHITDGQGALCVTNHLLHRHPDAANLPPDNPETMLSYQRYQRLAKSTGATMSGPALREALDEIGFDADSPTDYPVRTLWRTVFDLGARTMSTRFYLDDQRQSAELTYSV